MLRWMLYHCWLHCSWQYYSPCTSALTIEYVSHTKRCWTYLRSVASLIHIYLPEMRWAVLHFAALYNARTLRSTLQRSVTNFLLPCLNVLTMYRALLLVRTDDRRRRRTGLKNLKIFKKKKTSFIVIHCSIVYSPFSQHKVECNTLRTFLHNRASKSSFWLHCTVD